jgi:DNA topoisomerase-1
LKYTCNEKEKSAKRMKFSTLTAEDLRNAYQNSMPHLDFHLAEAGETRHIVDFLWGVNLSRMLTCATEKWSKKYITLSTGRVQGPVLKILAKREEDIHSFVPTPFWQIFSKMEVEGIVHDVEYEKAKITRKDDADKIVETCSGKTGIVIDVIIRKFEQTPPTPFDLGTLQAEAYRYFGYTPSQTLRIAERLYLDALISYPRTGSQKIPPSIDAYKILNNLGKELKYRELTNFLLKKEKLEPTQGTRIDTAHPAIYPTGNLPARKLSSQEERIFDLIARRFMAIFGEASQKESMIAKIDVEGYTFILHGKRTVKKGWLMFYEPFVEINDNMPSVKKGEKVSVKEIHCEEKTTQPPPRYNPSSLLKLMDENNIGTKATRAEIIDTLYKRGYIEEKGIVVTELGYGIIETLEKYCPKILSIEFTRDLEEKMEKIEKGDKSKEEVLEEAINQLKPILEEAKEKEEDIGKNINQYAKIAFLQSRIVGNCPTCDTGKLIILHSRKTGKRFIGCTNYQNGCRTSFPLPQRPYVVKPASALCKLCGWPVVIVKSDGKRPWRLCLRPDCPSKKRRG